jgi:hypothetical protein
MADQRIATLVQLLHSKTASGKLAWTTTEQDGVFQVVFPDFSVRIESRTQNDLWISIYNSNGDLIELAGDTSIGLDQAYRIMGELYEMARRKALGVDEALDKILVELEKT